MGDGSPTERTLRLVARGEHPHARTMRWLAIALLVAGCGGSDPGVMPTGNGGSGGSDQWPMVASGTWDAWLSQGQYPSCNGPLVLTLTQQIAGGPVALSGSWNCIESSQECLYVHTYVDASFACISYSGPASGTAQHGGAFSIDLTTSPGFGVTVTGTIAASGQMVGTAIFSDASVPFVAYPQ